jgi:hypothetical protein
VSPDGRWGQCACPTDPCTTVSLIEKLLADYLRERGYLSKTTEAKAP